MVRVTENPNLSEASCCKVLVVKGAAGDFVAGLVCTSSMVKMASLHFSSKRFTSSAESKFLDNSLLKAAPLLNSACTL